MTDFPSARSPESVDSNEGQSRRGGNKAGGNGIDQVCSHFLWAFLPADPTFLVFL